MIHVNPHLFGIDGATSACAASVAMTLSVTVSEKNWDLLPIAFGGIVGDRQTIRGLLGLNKYLGQLGQERGILEVRKGSLIPRGTAEGIPLQQHGPFHNRRQRRSGWRQPSSDRGRHTGQHVPGVTGRGSGDEALLPRNPQAAGPGSDPGQPGGSLLGEVLLLRAEDSMAMNYPIS